MISETLAARIAEATRLQLGQEAEVHGLIASAIFLAPYRYSQSAERQARFEMGFREGKAALAIDAMTRMTLPVQQEA